ncbi:phytochelatin synthase family protein [Paraburkholderia sp. GAS199]|uniref:phytochelatin synthase family protein n=1 Tax=Paraburkholderia sp. GAS199 TaxID=3035126 RepID=UPI003D1D1E25
MSAYSWINLARRGRFGAIVGAWAFSLAVTACTAMPPTAGQPVSATPTALHGDAPSAVQPNEGPLAVPPNLVALTQPAGQTRLLNAGDKQSYWPLSQYFETQRNQAYCSVATSVMVLNALGVRRPPSTQYPDFPYYSQEDFFRGVDPKVATAARVSQEGMTLDQLSAALAAFPVTVTKYHAADLTLAQFRDLIRTTTAQSDRFALVNFRRVEIGETGGGHWSPLGAYDAATDSALLLDVARYKYPAVWVPMAQLYAGALAPDSVSGISRGIVIVGKGTP